MRPLRARMRLSAHDAVDASRAHRGAPRLRAGRLSADLERAAPELRAGRRQRALGYEAIILLMGISSVSSIVVGTNHPLSSPRTRDPVDTEQSASLSHY